MLECSPFEGPAGEIDEVDSSFFEFLAQVATVFGCLAAGLELYGVDFDAYDEVGIWHAAMDLVDDFENDAAAVLEGATILIVSLVRRER